MSSASVSLFAASTSRAEHGVELKGEVTLLSCSSAAQIPEGNKQV